MFSYEANAKRLLDLGAIVLLLPVVIPVMTLVALAVTIFIGRPILFRQRRTGRNNIPFELVKFRTMRPITDQDSPDSDAARLLPFGKWLRKTSLDELPQLWNVWKGDMSLVGPRPLLPQYLPLYTQRQRQRHAVRPGITGWAQVNGRNGLEWEKKLELDVWYVAHVSLWVDLLILFLTVHRVLSGSAIAYEGHATAPYFTGSSSVEQQPGKELAVRGSEL
jgi:sugar transferase EpsL